MRHVFVETNWLVGYAAPAHQKVYAAIDLLKKANRREVHLYLPSICIAECRRPIREKFQVRLEADRVRRFLLWAKENKIVLSEAGRVGYLVTGDKSGLLALVSHQSTRIIFAGDFAA